MKKAPTYRLHKATGQAVVTIDGRDHYLGVHESAESKERYRTIVARWLEGRPDAEAIGFTVNELVAAHIAHVASRFAGRPHVKSKVERAKRVLGIVTRYHGRLGVGQFGPRALKVCRDEMIRLGWSRTYINECVGQIRACFRWGVSEELVDIAIVTALGTVDGLEYGTPGVTESEPRRDVTWSDVTRAIPAMPSPVAAAVLFQWWTGARPTEALQLRWSDVDRTNDVWVYRPRSHKNKHRRQRRDILIGPEGQAMLKPFLEMPADAFVFSPRAAIAEFWGDTPHIPGKHRPRDCYSAESYARAVRRACERAGVRPWSPYQLRHAFATRAVPTLGKDVTGKLIGQKSAQSIDVYDHSAPEAAAARQVG